MCKMTHVSGNMCDTITYLLTLMGLPGVILGNPTVSWRQPAASCHSVMLHQPGWAVVLTLEAAAL